MTGSLTETGTGQEARTAAEEKLASRYGEAVATRVLDALAAEHLAGRLRFLREGYSATVFEIEGSGLVLKIYQTTRVPTLSDAAFGRSDIANTKSLSAITDADLLKQAVRAPGRFCVQPLARAVLTDAAPGDAGGCEAQTVVEIAPKLTHAGVTRLHQECLRYKLWTEEGREFWDHLPAAGAPAEIKNVMLDARGVPYQIDSDAVRVFDDRWNAYPADANGRRSDAQYLQFRADCLDAQGKPDAMPAETFRRVAAACAQYDWPAQQAKAFSATVDAGVLAACRRAVSVMQPQRAMARR